MYGDLLLDRLGVKFLGPAPLHPELWHMLSNCQWNALRSTLGWWFCLLGWRLGGRKQIFGNPNGSREYLNFLPDPPCTTKTLL